MTSKLRSCIYAPPDESTGFPYIGVVMLPDGRLNMYPFPTRELARSFVEQTVAHLRTTESDEPSAG